MTEERPQLTLKQKLFVTGFALLAIVVEGLSWRLFWRRWDRYKARHRAKS